MRSDPPTKEKPKLPDIGKAVDPPIRRGKYPAPGELPPVIPGDGDGSDVAPRGLPLPKPDPVGRTDVFNRQKTPLRAVYGKKHIKGAHRVYDWVIPDGRRLVVYWVCWGEINSISNIKIDGQPIDFIGEHNVYLGNGSSAADSLMAAHDVRWATIPHPTDVAQVIVRFWKPGAERAWGQPQPAPDVDKFECDVEGLLVRDPRTDPTLVTKYYRENAMLAIADFDCDSRFGGRFPEATQDWADTVSDAADDCDADLGGGRLRFGPIGIELDTTMEYTDALEFLRGHAALNYAYNSGVKQWWVDKASTNTGITFTDEGSSANIVSVSPLIVKGVSQLPTRVTVWYTNESADWKRDFAVYEHPGLAGGSVELVERTYEFNGIRSHDHAYRLAKQYLKREWLDKSARIRVLSEGLQVLPGSIITVTSGQLNWAAVECQVTNCEPTPGRSTWDLDVVIWDDSVYDDNEATTTSYAPPANPSPYDQPDAPESPAGGGSLTVGDGLEVVAGGVNVTYSHPGWPHALWYRVTEQELGGLETLVTEVVNSNFDPVFVEVGPVTKTIRVYAIVAATLAISTALTGTAQPRPPYDVIAPSVNIPTSNVLTWTPPQILSDTTFDASFWSGSGMSALTAAAVNNGDKAVDALTFGTSTSQLIFDKGAGNSVDFRQVRLSSTTNSLVQGGLGNAQYIVKYGNSLGALTAVTVTGRNVVGATAVLGGVKEAIITWDAIPAGNRYIVIEAGTAAGASLAEVQFYSWLGADPNFAGVNVYEVSSGVPLAVATVLSTAAPSLNVNPWIIAAGNASVGLLHVKAVNSAGEESGSAITWRASVVAADAVSQGFVNQTGAQTLKNKEINLSSNTVVGTKAQFDAACSDGDFVYQSDVTELAQDAVGVMVTDTATIDFTYTDATPSLTADVKDDSITDAKLRNSAATSVIGRSANSTGDPADIAASADNQVLARSGGALGWTATPTLDGLNVGGTGSGKANVVGSGAYNAAGAARFDLKNSAWTKSWLQHVGDTGNYQLADSDGNTLILVTPGAGGSVDLVLGGSFGGGQVIKKHLSNSATWDPPSVNAAAQTTTTITVTGAALGDEVTVSFSLDLQGMQLTGYVSSSNTVTVVLRNGTAGAIDLASGTLRASVWRH